jgi:hypothetical protein
MTWIPQDESPDFMLAPSSFRPYGPDNRFDIKHALIRPLKSTPSLATSRAITRVNPVKCR